MSDALKRIEEYAQPFRDGIARCEAAAAFNMADWIDAYNRLARLRDRYDAEKDHLTPSERQALSKVFDNDVFIKGMIAVRQIGEHVTKRGGAVITTTGNAPISLDVETSAMAYYAAPRVKVADVKGQPQEVNHLERLQEAQKRIDAAILRARSGSP